MAVRTLPKKYVDRSLGTDFLIRPTVLRNRKRLSLPANHYLSTAYRCGSSLNRDWLAALENM